MFEFSVKKSKISISFCESFNLKFSFIAIEVNQNHSENKFQSVIR